MDESRPALGDLDRAHGDLMAWSGKGSLLKLVQAHEAAVRADQTRYDLEQARKVVLATDGMDRVDAAVDGLVKAAQSTTWQLARAVVENYLAGTAADHVGQELLRRMDNTERRQADG